MSIYANRKSEGKRAEKHKKICVPVIGDEPKIIAVPTIGAADHTVIGWLIIYSIDRVV